MNDYHGDDGANTFYTRTGNSPPRYHERPRSPYQALADNVARSTGADRIPTLRMAARAQASMYHSNIQFHLFRAAMAAGIDPEVAQAAIRDGILSAAQDGAR